MSVLLVIQESSDNVDDATMEEEFVSDFADSVSKLSPFQTKPSQESPEEDMDEFVVVPGERNGSNFLSHAGFLIKEYR